MRRAVRTILFFVAACVCAGRAWAQEEIDTAREAKIHVGGFYVTPTIELKEFGLDSNVFNETGQQTPDFTMTVEPGAKVDVPIARRALITTHADADFVYFAHYVNERSIDPNVDIRATGFFHRLTLFAGAGYLNTHQRPSQEVDTRVRRTDKDVLGGVELQLVPKLSIGIQGESLSSEYADDIFRGVDLNQALTSHADSATLSIKYRLTPLTTLVLRGDAAEQRFLYSPLKDADSYSVMPGVEFKPRALISGSAYFGFRQYKPLNSLVPEFRGTTAAMSLRYTLQSATAFTLLFNRDVQASYQDINPYYLNTTVGVTVRREIRGPYDTTVGATHYSYAYQDLLSPTNLGVSRVDTTENYSADIGYRVGRKGRLGVGVSYWTRSSSTASYVAYTGFRFGSTFSFNPQQQ